MTALLTRFWNDNNGQDMAEYALMLGIIGVAVAATVLLLSGDITALLQKADALIKAS